MARYIDADKLMEAIEKNIEPYKSWDCTKADVVMDTILEQPTADVEVVRHGHWIKQGNEKKCSVCEFVYYSNNDDWNGCPNCLAKMDGGRASHESICM